MHFTLMKTGWQMRRAISSVFDPCGNKAKKAHLRRAKRDVLRSRQEEITKLRLVKQLKERRKESDDDCDGECSNEMTTERDDNLLRPHSEKRFKMGAGMLLRRTLNMKYIKDPRKIWSYRKTEGDDPELAALKPTIATRETLPALALSPSVTIISPPVDGYSATSGISSLPREEKGSTILSTTTSTLSTSSLVTTTQTQNVVINAEEREMCGAERGETSGLGQKEQNNQSLISHKPLREIPRVEMKQNRTRGFWARLLGMENDESESEEESNESQGTSNSHGLE
eukprot:127125_1